MKSKKLSKKLNLNKSIIADLSGDELKKVKGGAYISFDTLCFIVCFSMPGGGTSACPWVCCPQAFFKNRKPLKGGSNETKDTQQKANVKQEYRG